jgi:hypothetical protein
VLQQNLIACHDFELLDSIPDPKGKSCNAVFKRKGANFVSRENTWHHLAVTWNAAKNGTTKVYQDGLLMAEVQITCPDVWHAEPMC